MPLIPGAENVPVELYDHEADNLVMDEDDKHLARCDFCQWVGPARGSYDEAVADGVGHKATAPPRRAVNTVVQMRAAERAQTPEPLLPPVYDQGSLGSSTASAAAHMLGALPGTTPITS